MPTGREYCCEGHTRTHARCVLLRSEEDNAAARAALRFHALKHALPIVEHLRLHCHLSRGNAYIADVLGARCTLQIVMDSAVLVYKAVDAGMRSLSGQCMRQFILGSAASGAHSCESTCLEVSMRPTQGCKPGAILVSLSACGDTLRQCPCHKMRQ